MRLVRILIITCCLLGLRLPAVEPAPAVPPELLPRVTEAKKRFGAGDFAGAEKVYNELIESAPGNVYLLSNLGVTLFRQGKYKLAEAAFLEAARIDPNDGFTHCTLGIVYYTLGKYDDAVNQLTKALAINPNDATAHNYLGITSSQKGRQDVAEKELQAAVKLDPKYADAFFNLAVVLATEQPPKKAEARKFYQRALELGAEPDPTLEPLLKDKDEPAQNSGQPPLHGMPSPVRSAVPSAANTLPESLQPLARTAREQFEADDLMGAVRSYRKLVDRAPDNVLALSNLAVAEYRLRKYELAADALRRAIAIAPENGFLHCTLGLVCFAQERNDEAVNELTKALACNPNDGLAHELLGFTAVRKGWTIAAEQEFARGLLCNTWGTPSFSAPISMPARFQTVVEVPGKTTRKYTLMPAAVGDYYTPLELERLRNFSLVP
jgi:tetratricopeptide (TPR) repeat protein